jgi:hypothetical protein
MQEQRGEHPPPFTVFDSLSAIAGPQPKLLLQAAVQKQIADEIHDCKNQKQRQRGALGPSQVH